MTVAKMRRVFPRPSAPPLRLGRAAVRHGRVRRSGLIHEGGGVADGRQRLPTTSSSSGDKSRRLNNGFGRSGSRGGASGRVTKASRGAGTRSDRRRRRRGGGGGRRRDLEKNRLFGDDGAGGVFGGFPAEVGQVVVENPFAERLTSSHSPSPEACVHVRGVVGQFSLHAVVVVGGGARVKGAVGC